MLASDFVTIPAALAVEAMRALADGGQDVPIVSGGSAAGGVGVLLATRADLTLRDQLGLNRSSRVVLFGGQGATDPQIYQELVGETSDTVFALKAARSSGLWGVRHPSVIVPGMWRFHVKTIGIVGGVAWPSSIVYYQTINELVARRLGGLHCASLVLAQADFAQIERQQREGRWDLVGDLVAVQGNKLKAAGADFFLLACNTVHAASDQIEKAVDLPFLHIVDPAARQVLAGGFQTVGLLGSRYTMTGSYFTSRLQQRFDLSVLVAEGAHQDNVHHALYEELAKGSFLPATRAKFQAAITDLVTRGAEVIVLACTEFGMLIKPQDSPIPIIDTATAHAQAAVDLALASD